MSLLAKTGRSACLFFTCIILFSACAEEKQTSTEKKGELYTFQEPHMGTMFEIRIWFPEKKNGGYPVGSPTQQGTVKQATAVVRKAYDRVAELNQIFSDYQFDSEVNAIRASPANQPIKVSKDILTILKKSEELHKASDGAFDVTIGPMVHLWRRSRKGLRLPTKTQIEVARSRTGFDKLQIDYDKGTLTKTVENMVLDFGGIVKGYAADEALHILRKGGFPHSLVAASGDIALGDAPGNDTAGWRVGLDTLEMAEPGEAHFQRANAAVSTSGDTQKFVIIDKKRYSHIVDKETGLGMTERIAVSILAPNAVTSDSYATTVSLLGKEKGLAWVEKQDGIECRIVTVAGEKSEITYSSGFPKN